MKNVFEEIELQDGPLCGGPALLEEEGGWCWYVLCHDCGAQTAHFEFNSKKDRLDAAKKAARLWNMGKVVRQDNGE